MRAAEEAEESASANDQTMGRVSDHRSISLSSGPSKNPAPPPRSPERQDFLLRVSCVAVAALLCELLVVRWRRDASLGSSMRLVCLLLLGCFLLLLMSKSSAEERLTAKVHRKLCEKLDDSFKGCQSTVKQVWIRLGGATEVGFGLTVAPPAGNTAATAAPPDNEGSSGGGGGATSAAADTAACAVSKASTGHLLAVRGCVFHASFLRTRAQPAMDAMQHTAEYCTRCFFMTYSSRR